MNDESGSVENDSTSLVALTADIVSAYVSNNIVQPADVPVLVATVHASIGKLGTPQEPPAPSYTPAVSIKKSVSEDAIISLIDGKPYRTLKRHLTGHGLTPEEYRQRYALPRDYPMVAPSYAAKRSALAKSIGLGANRRKAATEAVEPDLVVAEPAPKRRSRKASA